MRVKRRKRLAKPETLDGILDRSGENRFSRQKPPFSREVWVRAVGHRIAEKAVPLKLESGELLVLVSTHVWSNELSMLAHDVLSRLVSLGVPAIKLRFRVGRIEEARPLERRLRRKVPPRVDLPPALAEVVSGLEDSELMAEIRRAAEANLAWQSHSDPKLSLGASAPVAPTLPTAEAGNDRPARGSTSAPESGPRSPAGGSRRPP